MINIILTDAIKRIEREVKTNAEDYADIDAELQVLLQRMKTFRDFINSPTLDQLEKIEADTSEEVTIVRADLLEDHSPI
jgi:uncharacterized protein (UPF0335 family)